MAIECALALADLGGEVDITRHSQPRATATPHSVATPIVPRLLPTLRLASRHNQGAYLEYSSGAHRLHKELRIAFDDPRTLPECLNQKLLSLDVFLDDGLEAAFRNSCRFLDKAFFAINPTSTLPRICIKANRKEHGDALIIDVYRHYIVIDSATEKDRFLIDQDTGFAHVANTGTHFLLPNIPQAVRQGSYKNPRLDNDKARRYKPRFWKGLFSGRDLAWERCWKPHNGACAGPVPAEACYKSTLILPIGLSKEQLGPETSDTIGRVFSKSSHLESLIFAYLCFDHTKVNYFSETPDVDVGYLFAYMLSMYFSTRWILTVASNTYRAASEHCGN